MGGAYANYFHFRIVKMWRIVWRIVITPPSDARHDSQQQFYVVNITLMTLQNAATNIYRVRQKVVPLKFIAVFRATAWNFNAKFYAPVYSFHAHMTALSACN